ncbi:5' nucleotidase, NT5C type [Paludibacterium paludis]|nr:5'-3'-deoxyribonucleotidase [Paludibacterium paludis]
MLILVDQDGVLADFERGFYDTWRAGGHDFPGIEPAARRCFYVRDDYPREYREKVDAICAAKGFYLDLPPVEGAVAAMRAMLEMGLDVRICTSPLQRYRHCVPEKYEWVERHLGTEFVSRLILTRDKTLVHGDILVDDKPEITGVRTPDWWHVVFDQPYNRHIGGARATWADWQSVLLRL